MSDHDLSTDPTVPEPTWSWGDVPGHSSETAPGAPSAEAFQSGGSDTARDQDAHAAEANANGPDGTRYKPRTCRICFDEVQPTFEYPSTTTQFLGGKPRVRYVSEDPEFGRLMRPCKCKGSQKYVHEGCLRAWRMASPAQRNLWECPTCKYQYRLERLTWGKWASSKLVRAAVTLSIVLLTIFLLGFVAEPILNLGTLDPVANFLDLTFGEYDDYEELGDWIPDEQPDTWSWHFTRGFFALGLVGFFKSFLIARPLQWWSIRVGGRRRGGRDRLENINIFVILVGVATFLVAVWKAVSAMSARFLQRFSDTIVDVPGDDDDEDEDAGTESRKDQ